MPSDSLAKQFNTTFAWALFVVFGLPILCGCLFVLAIFQQARTDTQVWRHEFQFAIEQQCPNLNVDIEGGAGKVYLQAYQLDYQWVDGETQCASNGQTVRCNCATDVSETLVSGAQDEELAE